MRGRALGGPGEYPDTEMMNMIINPEPVEQKVDRPNAEAFKNYMKGSLFFLQDTLTLE